MLLMTLSRSSIRRWFALAASAATLISVGAAGEAGASFTTGVAGQELVGGDAAERAKSLQEASAANAQIARLTVSWASLVSQPPADGTDPADPAYEFGALDQAVQAVSAQGLQPLLTIQSAPSFAEGRNRPASVPPGTWKPRPGDLRQFAQAIASRYSGSFGGLPRVRYYQVWNEPNLSAYLTPQYSGKRAVSPSIYRGMLNAFYAGAKNGSKRATVITGGTAPYGDAPGAERMRPLIFLRDLLCIRSGSSKRARGCSKKARFDVLAHHPINTSGSPTRSAVDPDDATTADLKNVVSILRKAEHRRTTGTGGRHPVWATEIWWESNPPDRKFGIPLATQARYLEQALYILWKQGASVVINLQARDPSPSSDPDSVDAGLFLHDGQAKPAYTAFRFPFVTERRSAHRLYAWGRSPAAGRLSIQSRKDGRWRTVRSLRVRARSVFTASLKLQGRQQLRAVVGGERSLPWRQR